MLHGVEWLGRQYNQLSKPSGANSVEGTIETLSSRLTDPQVNMTDRRASILALKSLVRDHSNAVAIGSMSSLIHCLVALEPAQGNEHGMENKGRDEETTRAVVECLAMLCDPLVNKDEKLPPKYAKAIEQQHLGRVDLFLSSASALHSVLPLLSPTRAFYTRFASLQLLSSLVRSRPSRVQDHVLVAPGGCGAILECLSEGAGSSAEIVRNEALLLIPHLVKDNADIQKLVAFEGAFEKLIDVVALEGRIEGGVVAQDALEGLEALLKYNVSNQNYFRETLSIPLLAPLLFYPPPLVSTSGAPSRQAEQEHARQLEAFAFQSWDAQKLINASLVISIAGMLVAGVGEGRKSNQNAVLSSGLTKALFELALASTAPQKLKCQALNVLGHVMKNNRPNQEFLSGLMICPLVGNRVHLIGSVREENGMGLRQDETASRASAEGGASSESGQAKNTPETSANNTPAPLLPTGGDEEEDDLDIEMNWTRLPARPAILVLIGMAVNGPSSPSTPISSLKGLPMRTACLTCFSSFVADNLDVRLAILGTMMSPSEGSEDDTPLSAGAQLLQGLSSFPTSDNLDPYKHLISALLFSHLIGGSETAKKLAREISFGPDGRAVRREEGSKPQPSEDDDDDENASLIQVLVGNLTMAAREQSEAVRKARSAQSSSVAPPSSSSSKEPTEKDWLRVQVSYLLVLCTWLFDSPLSVKDLLSESANLQVLIQPVAQGGGANDALIQGLSAFILGEVYEFGPQPQKSNKSQNQNNNNGGQGKKGKHGKNASKNQNSQQPQEAENLPDSSSVLDREAIQPILISRIGPDTFASRLDRVREDERFKEVDPEILEKVGLGNSLSEKSQGRNSMARELWFDFQFVEFWKNNYVLIQKSILVDPSSTSRAAASTSTELLDAQRQAEELRDTVNRQSREIELLEGRMSEMKKAMEGEISTLKSQLTTLESSISSHPAALADLQSKLDSSSQEHSKSLEEVNSKHAELSSNLLASEENLKKSESKIVDLSKENSDLKESHSKELEQVKQELNEKVKELERVKATSTKDQSSAKKEAEKAKSTEISALSEEERKELEELKSKKEEMEKENEDLLVLLEELSSKRKKDKTRMKEKGLEVSEDEEEDDDDDDEEE